MAVASWPQALPLWSEAQWDCNVTPGKTCSALGPGESHPEP